LYAHDEDETITATTMTLITTQKTALGYENNTQTKKVSVIIKQ